MKAITLDRFINYVEARPASLGCWRDGVDGRYQLLAWLNARPVMEFKELAVDAGPHIAAMTLIAQHHNQVGISAGWMTRYMVGPARKQKSSEADRLAIFKTAASYRALQNALVEVRVGVRTFEATGSLIRLPYQGERSFDALDRLFDFLQNLDSVGKAQISPNPNLRRWFADEGLSQTWQSAPVWVKEAFRDYSRQLIASYDSYLPENAKIGIVTMADLGMFWNELLAWGSFMHTATMHGSNHLPTTLPLISRPELVKELVASTSLQTAVVEAIVELLTLDLSQCSDGALTPLVPIDDQLIPMSSLIVPTSPYRNFLGIVQSRPSLMGEAGRLLGGVGEQTAFRLLERLNGCLTASRVRVRRLDGSTAGDLDVVACDPVTRTAVIFEIKWGIAAHGNAEVYRIEQQAIDKRKQVVRLRREIGEGSAIPQWPSGWPVMTDFELNWYVLTRDVLAMRHVSTDDVTIRSYQFLSRTLRKGATIADLISLLDSPPLPPDGLVQTQWERIRYGDLQVEVECMIT